MAMNKIANNKFLTLKIDWFIFSPRKLDNKEWQEAENQLIFHFVCPPYH